MPNRATDRIAKDDEVILRRSEYDDLMRRLEDLEDRGTVERVRNERTAATSRSKSCSV